MKLNRDPIEMTEEYLEAMEGIEPVLDKEFPENEWRMGMCHVYWHRKKELLAKVGIGWRSPGEMNPDVRFD